MTIEKISKEEFKALSVSNAPRGTTMSSESQAIQNLAPEESIKFPCRWTHGRQECRGISNFRGNAYRHGRRLSAVCRDGTVYVMRVA